MALPFRHASAVQASRRIRREKKTAEAMIAAYCRAHHGGAPDLCNECRELLDYAFWRLDRCPFRDAKPACARCTIHCYTPEMRERIRLVMRYSGPRMLLRHPLLAALHVLDKFRRAGKPDGRSR